jgi:hypothetical protein
MDDEPTLNLLLSDLWTIYNGCGNKKLEEVGLDYLLANRKLIEFYLEQAYTKTDDAQRGELQKEHPELHASAIRDEGYPMARAILSEADLWGGLEPLKRMAQIDRDRVDSLLRGLQYAKYCSLDTHNYQFAMSPITQYMA